MNIKCYLALILCTMVAWTALAGCAASSTAQDTSEDTAVVEALSRANLDENSELAEDEIAILKSKTSYGNFKDSFKTVSKLNSTQKLAVANIREGNKALTEKYPDVIFIAEAYENADECLDSFAKEYQFYATYSAADEADTALYIVIKDQGGTITTSMFDGKSGDAGDANAIAGVNDYSSDGDGYRAALEDQKANGIGAEFVAEDDGAAAEDEDASASYDGTIEEETDAASSDGESEVSSKEGE